MDRERITETAELLADMNVFAALIAILEGGCIHAISNEAAAQIIAISKRHQNALCRKFDRDLATVPRRTATRRKSAGAES